MNIFLDLIVSTAGLAYFIYGKKTTDFKFLLFGFVLMIYPYFVSSTFVTVILGIILVFLPVIAKKIF